MARVRTVLRWAGKNARHEVRVRDELVLLTSTERQRADEALQKSEERLRTLSEAAWAMRVERVLQLAERNIIRELLDYTRDQTPQLTLTDVDAWLDKVLDEQVTS